MLILRTLAIVGMLMVKLPGVVRLGFFLCLGAASEAAVASFLAYLPMDPLTKRFFCGLQWLLLGAFAVDMIRRVIKNDLPEISKVKDFLKREVSATKKPE